MKIKIYQIDMEKDKHDVKFQGLEVTYRFQESQKINSEIYKRVFMGDVDCEGLEEVYQMFNLLGHRLHRGHSLSVSDIVEVEQDGNTTYHFCDSVGFQEVEFEPEKAHPSEEVIRVLVVEPHRKPYESEIGTTLQAEQRAVEGEIEYIMNEDETITVVNLEGKNNGAEGNRRVDGDILCGSFFVAGDNGEELCSLTDEQMEKYMERFAEPEEISKEEITAYTGYTIMT